MGVWTTETADTSRNAPGSAYDSSANLTYTYGGINNSGTFLTTNNAYSKGSNTWTSKTGLTAAIDYLASAYDSSANLSYSIDGNLQFGITNALYAYAEGSNTWSTKAVDSARLQLGAAYDSSANLTYAVDGLNNSFAAIGTMTAYSEGSNTWTTETSDTVRAGPGSAYDSSANLTYAIQGEATVSSTFITTVTAYSHGGNSWTSEATLSPGRQNASCAYDSSANLTYQIDGFASSESQATSAYSQGSNTWTAQTNELHKRDSAGCAYDSTANLTYVIDGENSGGTTQSFVTAFNEGIQTQALTASQTFSGSLSTSLTGNGQVNVSANLHLGGSLQIQRRHSLTGNLVPHGDLNVFHVRPTVGFLPIL